MHDRPRDCTFLSHPQPRGTGDYVHRVTWPAAHLARHLPVTEIQTGHPGFVAQALRADLLVVAMVADPAIERLIDARRRRGLPTVYEISDDFKAFPPDLPLHGFYADPRTQALIERTAARADLLQCSSHGLVERYGRLNAAHALFPNQTAAPPPLPVVTPARRARPVIGWGASSGHLDDARRLAQWIATWLGRRPAPQGDPPEIRLMVPEPLAAAFEQRGLLVQRHPTGSFDDYLAFLDGIDIGLAVIDDSPFARCRSDGKYLEYASRGVVCVASARGEYLHGVRDGETGVLFDGFEAFARAMDRLSDDAGTRESIRLAAWRDVSTRRTHAQAAHERLASYAALYPTDARRAPRAGDAGGAPLVVLADPAEDALTEATALHARGMLAPALQAYLSIIERHPGFHVPWERAALLARALNAPRDADAFARAGAAALDAQLGEPG
jgi:hypothetical protein